MNQEDREILKEYLVNCERQRNQCLFRNQSLAALYYQGMIDIIAQILVDEEYTKANGYQEVT